MICVHNQVYFIDSVIIWHWFCTTSLSTKMLLFNGRMSEDDVYVNWLNRVNCRDPKAMVTPVVRETHSVMACLIQSRTVALENVSYLNLW